MPTKPFSLIPPRSIGTYVIRTEMHTLQACWPPLNENYWFLYKKVYLLIPFLSYAILCPPSSYTWQMKKGLDLVKCFIRRHRCYFPSPLLSIPLSLCSVFQHQPNPPSRAQLGTRIREMHWYNFIRIRNSHINFDLHKYSESDYVF